MKRITFCHDGTMLINGLQGYGHKDRKGQIYGYINKAREI